MNMRTIYRRTTIKIFPALRGLALCLAVISASAAAQPTADRAALEAAAQRGDVPALMMLAGIYERGENVEQDLTRSNALYCKAAARGNVDAILKLGKIYASGREVMPNEGVGALLINKAAELGSERAKEILPYISRGVGSVLPACMNEPISNGVVSLSAPKVRKDIALLVQHWAPQYSVDPELVMALIAVESRFDATAVSPKNAQGLMQLIPATAARFGVKNAFNALDNLKGGLAYLRWLLAYFKGDVALVLAAYNAGEETVERYRGIPPYRETRDYVKQITSVYKKSNHPYLAELVTSSSITSRIKRTE
ncbi:MAG TPA: transglycosylase SLT domain-containing protein [Steroidobacteraceae bacterium]|nr:transglycosylase SLT domain-containing protein [Steroidobacteraceae bacterium]